LRGAKQQQEIGRRRLRAHAREQAEPPRLASRALENGTPLAVAAVEDEKLASIPHPEHRQKIVRLRTLEVHQNALAQGSVEE
jgi:hypothetical protein